MLVAQQPSILHVYTPNVSALLVIIIRLVTHNVEELQAVLALARADNTQPIPKLLLLEELLRQVLQVPPAELLMRDDFDTSIAEVGDCDSITEVACSAVDLDALLEKGRES